MKHKHIGILLDMLYKSLIDRNLMLNYNVQLFGLMLNYNVQLFGAKAHI